MNQKFCAASVALWTLTAATATYAQSVSPAGSEEADKTVDQRAGVEDIVVTARRVTENVQSVPISVSALSGATLEAEGVRNVQDLGRTLPNVTLPLATIDPTALNPTIRGQRQSDQTLTIDPAVGVYVDEVNYPRSNGLKSALIDIERVEVLRGPQGTLYGRNTTGGAIGIITRDPTTELGASVQVMAGNNGLIGATIVSNLPLGEGTGLRVVGHLSDSDGYGRYGTGAKIGGERSGYARAKFVTQLGAASIKLTVDYANLRAKPGLITKIGGLNPATSTLPAGGVATREVALEVFGNTTPASLAAAEQILQGYVASDDRFYDSGGTYPSVGTFKGGGVGLVVDLPLSDTLTLKSVTGFRKFVRATTEDLDSTPYAILHAASETRDRFWSQEVQMQMDFGRLKGVIGGYASDERGTEHSETRALQAVTNFNVGLSDTEPNNRSLAFYGQANWEMVDDLTLTLGGRYTTEDRNLEVANTSQPSGACSIPAALRPTPTTCRASLSSTFSNFSWLASLDYQIAPDILIYGRISTGFRSGGQQRSGASVAAFAPFRPETLTEYEIGVKSTFLDRRIRLNVAAYYDDYKDVQRSASTLVPGGAVALIYSNAAKAKLKGFEAELQVRPVTGLQLQGAVGYLNARYTAFNDALIGNRTDEPWPAPDWNYSVGASYSAPTSFGDVSFNLTYAGQSSVVLRPEAVNRAQLFQKGYGLLSGRLSAKIDAIDAEIAIFGRNLTKTRYDTAAVSLESLGFNMLLAGEPRTFGVQLTKKFGGER